MPTFSSRRPSGRERKRTRAGVAGHLEQGSLFGPGEDRLQAPAVRYTPDPERVRQRLKALLEKARSAKIGR